MIASPTNEGKQIVGQLVDIVFALINQWYPDLNELHGGIVELSSECYAWSVWNKEEQTPLNLWLDQCLACDCKK